MSVRRLAPLLDQPASFAFTPENLTWLDGQVAKYPDGRQASAVIPALWQAQKQNGGWLPQKAIEAVAVRLGMPTIRVMEVATFYTMFNLEPVGRYYIQLCGTVPCHVKGAIDLKQTLLNSVGDERHVTEDGYFSWLEVECLGACCNAPMVQINDEYYEDLTPDLLIKLIDDLRAGRDVKVGPQDGRVSSEPKGGAKTLTDPALFDGSLVGGWRTRFENSVTAETDAGSATGKNDMKPGRPGATNASQSSATNAPAQSAQNGESPKAADDKAGASDTSKTTVSEPGASADAKAPQSDKSYTMTPSKPEEGRVVAGSKGTTPISGTPTSGNSEGGQGAGEKPAGVDPGAKPGAAPGAN